MNPLDDKFREALSGRRPDVPAGLWDKVAARKGSIPAGEALDRTFADKLRDRRGVVPTGMWARITAARTGVATTASPGRWRYLVAAILALLLFGGLLFWGGNAGKDPPPTQQPAIDATESGGPDVAQTFPKPAESTRAEKISNGSLSPEPPTTVTETGDRNLSGAGSTPSTPDTEVTSKISATTSIAPRRRAATVIAPLNAIPATPPLFETATEIEIKPQYQPQAPSGEPFRASGRNRLQTEILVGIGYANQQLGLQAENARGQRDLRMSSEFPEPSYNFSVRLRYDLRGRFHLLTGLTYAELRNQFEYDNIGSTGLERSNNAITMLELPILLGYELPGRRFRLNLNAGPLLNLSTGVRGRFLRPDSADPLSLRTDGNYRNNTGLGWTASLTATYYIGKQKNVQLLLEPFFKDYVGSFTQPDAPLSERYWVAGLQVGLRKQLH